MKFGRETYFLLIVFIVGEIAGLTLGLYNPIHEFDLLMHFIGGMLVSSITIYFLLNHFKRFSFLANVLMTIGIGALWEIVEFLLDQLLGLSTQAGLFDTMTDLIIVLIAALIINGAYAWAHRK